MDPLVLGISDPGCFCGVLRQVVKQRLQAGVYATTREALVTMYTKEGGMAAFFGRGGVTSQVGIFRILEGKAIWASSRL